MDAAGEQGCGSGRCQGKKLPRGSRADGVNVRAGSEGKYDAASTENESRRVWSVESSADPKVSAATFLGGGADLGPRSARGLVVYA